MTNVLWVTTDKSDMTIDHHKLLMQRFMKTGLWIKCFQFTDVSSESKYQGEADNADVIAFDEHFPLHLLPRIIRKDKECFVAVTIKLPSSQGETHELHRWKRIESDFMCTMTDVLG